MTQYFSKWIYLSIFVLSGCGGGGGSLPPPPLTLFDSSYANKNLIALEAPQIPSTVLVDAVPESITFGDFFQEGAHSAFLVAPSSVSASGYQAHFLKKDASGWHDATSTLLETAQADACPTVRQSLTADFNGDGKPDVYLVCRGASMGVAVRQVLYLSSANQNKYTRSTTTDSFAALHASAANLDRDATGRMDIITVDESFQINVLINGGAAVFSKDDNSVTHRIPAGLPNSVQRVFLIPSTIASTTEGPDLVVAGSLTNGYSLMWLKNDGTGKFNTTTAGWSRSFTNPVSGGGSLMPSDFIKSGNYFYVLDDALKQFVRFDAPTTVSSSVTSALPLSSVQPTNNQPTAFPKQVKLVSSGFVPYDGKCADTSTTTASSASRCNFLATAP